MRKVCVISGTRADYGLLFWTMKGLQESKEFELQTIVTCMHLDPKFGETWKEFEKDGFPVSKKVELGKIEDSKESVVNQVSIGVKGFYNAYTELSPDLVIILGDRYEMLAAAQAAIFSDIPIAHIHGGEITEGAFDDMIRHSITKMSSYHFTSTDEYRGRVIQMGEFPESVLNVGAVGLENIAKFELMPKEELESSLNFQLKDKNLLVTYHPVTAANENATDALIECLKKRSDLGQIITLPNSDPGHDSIFKALNGYAKDRENVYLTNSLGFKRYLSAMKLCDVVVGNSSSGIIEAPFMGTPTLNIGVRQKGRLADSSVIHSEVREIDSKLDQALKLEKRKSFLYGDGNSSSRILDFLISADFKSKRGFYNG